MEQFRNSESIRFVQIDSLSFIFGLEKGIICNVSFELMSQLLARLENSFENAKENTHSIVTEQKVRNALYSLFGKNS